MGGDFEKPKICYIYSTKFFFFFLLKKMARLLLNTLVHIKHLLLTRIMYNVQRFVYFFLCQSSHLNKNTFLASNRIFDKNHTLKVLLKKVITIPPSIPTFRFVTLLYLFTYLLKVCTYVLYLYVQIHKKKKKIFPPPINAIYTQLKKKRKTVD